MLIVDDHPTFRRFARLLLEDAGFVVVGEAGDGAGAIRAVRELEPEVVLLDVLLPDTSGLDVAATLAGSSYGPAVVLTSSREADDFGAALSETPARSFIAKSDLTGAAFAAALEP